MPIEDAFGGPYLTAALFCERVLNEQDGVPSLIRVVDRFHVSGATPEMELTVLKPTLFISFKSGHYRGSTHIVVTPTTPSGLKMLPMVFSAFFEGDDDRGVSVIGPLAFAAAEPGLYWFDVSVAERAATRVSLRIVYHTTHATGSVGA